MSEGAPTLPEKKKNPYEIMGVPPEASDKDIKDRYRELGIRIVRVRIDEALRLVGARLSAIGAAA